MVVRRTNYAAWHFATTDRSTHDHMVLDEPLRIGTLKRDRGDALCRRALAFRGDWIQADAGTLCPACARLAADHNLQPWPDMMERGTA